MNLADHGERLPGIRVGREAVDKGQQHMQRLDPALLGLQVDRDLIDRILQTFVVAAAGEVQLLIRFGGPQWLSHLLPCLGNVHGRLVCESVGRIVIAEFIPDADRLVMV